MRGSWGEGRTIYELAVSYSTLSSLGHRGYVTKGELRVAIVGCSKLLTHSCLMSLFLVHGTVWSSLLGMKKSRNRPHRHTGLGTQCPAAVIRETTVLHGCRCGAASRLCRLSGEGESTEFLHKTKFINLHMEL